MSNKFTTQKTAQKTILQSLEYPRLTAEASIKNDEIYIAEIELDDDYWNAIDISIALYEAKIYLTKNYFNVFKR